MHTLDATDKKMGRLATQAAVLLMGKNTPNWSRNAIPTTTVAIINASKMSVSESKKNEVYKNFSGYPGGLKTQTLEELVEKKGYSEALKKAIYGMLPTNRLRPKMMKNLSISE